VPPVLILILCVAVEKCNEDNTFHLCCKAVSEVVENEVKVKENTSTATVCLIH